MTEVAQTRALEAAKGRPLVVLAVLLSVWIAGRMMLWESPIPVTQLLNESAGQLLARNTESSSSKTLDASFPDSADATAMQTRIAEHSGARLLHSDAGGSIAPLAWDKPVAPELAEHPSAAGSHSLVWLAAMSHLPMPSAMEDRMAQVTASRRTEAIAHEQPDRWSLDAWVFWRDGGEGALISQSRGPTYGASQAGAVLNYRLAPGQGRDPRAYARVYRALINNGESELAAGASARPFAQIPLRAHAELRITEFESGIKLRPAAFVTTELPAFKLPFGAQAEAYGQAGYVAGEAATVFADGQVHILREVQSFDLGSMSVGAAAWGGAQEGAQRVDVGPSLRADITIGGAPARVSVDYRERVAGDAEPPSGVAVTLSTRF